MLCLGAMRKHLQFTVSLHPSLRYLKHCELKLGGGSTSHGTAFQNCSRDSIRGLDNG